MTSPGATWCFLGPPTFAPPPSPAQLRQTVPSIDPEEATGLAFASGAHTLLLAPEEAADVIADLLRQSSDALAQGN